MTQPANVDGFYLTRADQEKLRTTLNTLTDWLAAELDTTITRQTAGAAGPRVTLGRHRDTPLPYNPAAADAAQDLHRTLTTWATNTATHRALHLDPADTRTIRAAARWLHAHTTALALTEGADTAATQIHHATKRARNLIDRRPRPDYLGTCPAPDCGHDLYAHKGADPIVCTHCAETHHRTQIEDRIDTELRRRLFTARELVDIVHDRIGHTITMKTIHNLARHTLTVRGTTHRGEHLYLCADVLDTLMRKPATATRRNRN